jgi:hypothetical protein
MVKRAPVNVRYLWLFGEHILARSFTARDPKPTFLDRSIDPSCWPQALNTPTYGAWPPSKAFSK